MPLKCQIRLFERQSTPGYFKCKRQIGFYFPKTGDFRAVSENKTRFENGFEHPGGVVIFKCVSNRVCEISVIYTFCKNIILGNTFQSTSLKKESFITASTPPRARVGEYRSHACNESSLQIRSRGWAKSWRLQISKMTFFPARFTYPLNASPVFCKVIAVQRRGARVPCYITAAALSG